MKQFSNKKQELSSEQIKEYVLQRLEKYKNLNFFEEYAMFMGLAQILEFGLKKLLEENYGYELESMDKWTLGKIKVELERNGLRPDFIDLLKSIVDYRNYIAHELLSNNALMKVLYNKLIPENHYSKEHRVLHKAIYELEQLIFLFDWTNENNGW